MASSDVAIEHLMSDEAEKELKESSNVQKEEPNPRSSSDMNSKDLNSLTVKVEKTDDNIDKSKTLGITDNDNESKDHESQEHDPYSYTKLNDFTSEIFKIEINNLPGYVGYGVSNL